jgi:TRAP-type C4-dicarboxylate transport system permease large subunit
MPIYYPIITGFGFSGIWFGVLIIAMIEIGQVSPPFGMVAYALNAAVPEISLVKVFKGCAMFFLIELGVVALLIAFPGIPVWLPNLMK